MFKIGDLETLMMTSKYKYQVGDSVSINGQNEVYEISGLAFPTAHRWYHLKNFPNEYTVDGSFQEENLRLVPSETAYDSTQMGDKEDDI